MCKVLGLIPNTEKRRKREEDGEGESLGKEKNTK